MKGLDAKNVCTHGGDMLAYLYDEMGAPDREVFELHLADCGTCIDDFAELSQSRYPVFEWKKLEFDLLPTPRIVLEAEDVSWLSKIRAAFALRPSLAFGSVAVITLVASFSFFAMISGSGKSSAIANVEAIATPALPEPFIADEKPTMQREVEIESPRTAPARREEPRAVKASSSETRSPNPPIRPKTTQQARRMEKVPTLNAVEEEEDDSLRLADIFDEIGSS